MPIAPRAPSSAYTLACLRIVVPLIVLASPELRSCPAYAALPKALIAPPEGLGLFAQVVPIEPSVAQVARIVLMLACVLGALGLVTRVALSIATIAAIYVFALPQLGGTVLHDMHLVWWLALLALSPAGDVLSLDARIGPKPPRSAATYEAPLLAVRVLLGIVYFFPGVWKLAESGADWIFSDNLRNHMRWKWFETGGQPALIRVDQLPWLCRAGAGAVIVFELGFLPMVVVRKLRPIAVAMGLAFHLASHVFMRIPFPSLWIPYVALVDMGRLLAWAGFVEIDESASPRVSKATPALAAAAIIAIAQVAQGIRGHVQAWPFACYPTFQWLAGDTIPDVQIEAPGEDGAWVALADSGAKGARATEVWAMAWRIAGAYGKGPSEDEMRAYLKLRHLSASRARFYRVTYEVAPEAWGHPPSTRTLVGEIAP